VCKLRLLKAFAMPSSLSTTTLNQKKKNHDRKKKSVEKVTLKKYEENTHNCSETKKVGMVHTLVPEAISEGTTTNSQGKTEENERVSQTSVPMGNNRFANREDNGESEEAK
jgi:hypothetical protein